MGRRVADDCEMTFDSASFVRGLTHKPGVYRMLDAQGNVLYVGKARDLRNRVSSYFRAADLGPKTRAMVRQVSDVQVTVTATETEALLLEQTLIKTLRPFYNIMWRDGKSYPYIQLTDHENFPSLKFYRGARFKRGTLFGPYPDSGAVRNSLKLLQKVFRIRQCEDTFFKNRSRPCLQYQIGRCSAPCVNLIDAQAYKEDMRHAVMFLKGKSRAIIAELQDRMNAASEALEFERAGAYRDRIRNLNHIREQQSVVAKTGDFDVIVVVHRAMMACVLVLFIRGGCVIGQRPWFLQDHLERGTSIVLTAFLSRFYLEGERGSFNVPSEIILGEEVADIELLTEIIRKQTGKRVSVTVGVKGRKARWCVLAATNAEQQFNTYLGRRQRLRKRFEALGMALGSDVVPRRMECFDVSHTFGEMAVASCVVFDSSGPLKSGYRRFNITNVDPGDDYAAMRQVLGRRYSKIGENPDELPDVLIVDGGKGQVSQAAKVLADLRIDDVHILGIAKGPSRKPGLETLIKGTDGSVLDLDGYPEALYLLQHIRDEAHRFALAGHIGQRRKARRKSGLDGIAAIGPARKRQLLRHFGGMRGIRNAGIEDLVKTPGISRQLAGRIYAALHGE